MKPHEPISDTNIFWYILSITIIYAGSVEFPSPFLGFIVYFIAVVAVAGLWAKDKHLLSLMRYKDLIEKRDHYKGRRG